jgi:hypothetical protein
MSRIDPSLAVPVRQLRDEVCRRRDGRRWIRGKCDPDRDRWLLQEIEMLLTEETPAEAGR